MELDILDQSRQLKRVVLIWISLVLSIITLAFSVYNYTITQSYVFSSIEFLFSALAAYVCIQAKNDRHTSSLVSFFSYSLVSVVGIGTHLHPFESGLFIWTCLIPIMLYLLNNKIHAFIATGALFILQFSNIINSMGKTAFLEPTGLLLNLSSCYLCIWLLSHVFEANRETAEACLVSLAAKDVLTNTWNRLALVHQFPIFQSTSSGVFCLLILDLDYFKQVNDEFGHSAGDKVLIETAKLLKKLVGSNNVYRIGGEEFCITLPNRNISDAEVIANTIRKVLSKHNFKHKGNKIHTTASIGVCECSADTLLESVLSKADGELYKAKKNGRNQVMVCQEDKELIVEARLEYRI